MGPSSKSCRRGEFWLRGGGVRGVLVTVALLLGGCGHKEEPEGGVQMVRGPLAGWAIAVGNETEPMRGLPTRIKRVRDGGFMRFVRGGEFRMGAVSQDSQAWDNEKPSRRISVLPFYLDETEVTVSQYEKYARSVLGNADASEQGGEAWLKTEVQDGPTPSRRASWLRPLPGVHDQASSADPVVQINWREASAYASWAGVSLPSEAEFEFALRGGVEGRVYPWGDDVQGIPKDFANVIDAAFVKHHEDWRGVAIAEYDDGYEWWSPAGNFHANKFGVHDLCGNVAEWCLDYFA